LAFYPGVFFVHQTFVFPCKETQNGRKRLISRTT